MSTLGMRTSIGARPHRVTVQNPGVPKPDGDGGYIVVPDVSPDPWQVSIVSAEAKDLQNAEGGTVLATKVHIVRGQFRKDISTITQLVFTDLDGTVHTFDIDGVDNIEQRNFELVCSCTETETHSQPAPPVANTLDDFNRADETPLQGTDMQWMGSGFFDGALRLMSNLVGWPNLGQAGSWWMTPFVGDFEVSVEVATMPEGGANSNTFGLVLSPDRVSGACFTLGVFPNTAPQSLILQLPDASRPYAEIPGTFTDGDRIALTRIGTHMHVKVSLASEWHEVLDIDQPDQTGPLYAAIWVQNYTPSALTRLDNFSGSTP